MKKAIIIGASSGIGKALAELLAKEGYVIGTTARRIERLNKLKDSIGNQVFVKFMDIANTSEAINTLEELIKEMNGVDLFIINAGIGFVNNSLDWSKEQHTIDVNVSGFAAMANIALKHFIEKGSGHLVGISSIAAIKGNASAPAYNASKAFMSNYLEGLRIKCYRLKLPVTITDIKPGYVDTEMAKGNNIFWMATPEKAAKQIYDAIKKRKTHAYITKRWWLIGIVFKIIPDWLYSKL